MNRRLLLALAPLVALLGSCAVHPSLEPGQTAPTFRVPTADGDTLSLDRFAGRTVVLIWVDPMCAAMQRALERGVFHRLEKAFAQDSSIAILYIASSSPRSADYLKPMEYLSWQKEQKLGSAAVFDTLGTLAKAYAVTRTPTAVVIDPSGLVRYSGPIDVDIALDPYSGEPRGSARQVNFLEGAIDSVRHGRAPVPDSNPPAGCRLAR